MKTKEIVVSEPRSLAENLYTVQEQIAFLKEQEDEIKEKLLGVLQKTGVTFLKLENGVTYTRSHRETLKPKQGGEDKAYLWAQDNHCLKIDTTKAMNILRRELKMPKFFERVIGEDYLTVKKAGQKHED